jgi:hypothetical protein
MTDETPSSRLPSPADKTTLDLLAETKELAAINPRVMREMARILMEKKAKAQQSQQPANTDASQPSTNSAPIAVAAPPIPAGQLKTPLSRKKNTPMPSPKPLSRLELHRSRCCICCGNHQEEIDEAFVNWEFVGHIAEEYKINRRAIYRHAHATGLFEKRDQNIRRALGRIIHEADHVAITGDTVVRAIKILTHVNTHGEWVQPPTQIIYSSATANAAAAAPAVRARKLPKRSDTTCKVKKRLKH